MKNKLKDRNYLKRREKIEKLMSNPEEFKNKMQSEITSKDFEIVYEIARDSRIEGLIENLGIDKKEYEKAKGKIVKLSPSSTEFPLLSTLYRKHNGKYKVEDLINQYHDSVLREGIEVGIEYGKKFLAEDIQNKRFTKKDIMKMSKQEIDKYCDEIRDEI